MASSWRPDIVVGIDFGMTCTGVAYSMGPEWPEPKTIQRWPGKLGHELRNKVDTSISYDLKTGAQRSWGFLCTSEDESCEFNELFKLYLDPNYEDPSGLAPSIQVAQTWFRDYMQNLHRFIDQYFSETVPRLELKRVEYVFSIPTTWKDPSLVAAMEGLIKDAGFGQKSGERASIFLTEAEAAAVYSTKRLESGEVFLVCDAGGGTTDLNVLKIISTAQPRLELKPLSWTEGFAVGSTLIDFKARRRITERLRPIQNEIPGDLETVVGKLIDDQFRTFKCSFGVDGMDIPRLILPIPGMPPGKSFPEYGIEQSRLIMTTAELRTIFDEQVDKMFGLIDQQLQIVQNSHPREQISYLILSGGLSSSPYVQKRARARYEQGGQLRLQNVQGLRVLLAAEPQLAVCHGLVIARTQKLRSGTDVYTMRCSPVSYGLLCREAYDPERHQGETIVEDDFTGAKWALGQINWIVRQGEPVSTSDGVCQKYRHKLRWHEFNAPQHATVLMSTLPAHQLPSSMRRGGAKQVCQIEFVVAANNMKLKNRHWYNRGQKYYRAEYEVRAIIGTGLTFQIWGQDGLLSRSHEEIDVMWQPFDERGAAPKTAEPIEDAAALYRYQ